MNLKSKWILSISFGLVLIILIASLIFLPKDPKNPPDEDKDKDKKVKPSQAQIQQCQKLIQYFEELIHLFQQKEFKKIEQFKLIEQKQSIINNFQSKVGIFQKQLNEIDDVLLLTKLINRINQTEIINLKDQIYQFELNYNQTLNSKSENDKGEEKNKETEQEIEEIEIIKEFEPEKEEENEKEIEEEQINNEEEDDHDDKNEEENEDTNEEKEKEGEDQQIDNEPENDNLKNCTNVSYNYHRLYAFYELAVTIMLDNLAEKKSYLLRFIIPMLIFIQMLKLTFFLFTLPFVIMINFASYNVSKKIVIKKSLFLFILYHAIPHLYHTQQFNTDTKVSICLLVVNLYFKFYLLFLALSMVILSNSVISVINNVNNYFFFNNNKCLYSQKIANFQGFVILMLLGISSYFFSINLSYTIVLGGSAFFCLFKFVYLSLFQYQEYFRTNVINYLYKYQQIIYKKAISWIDLFYHLIYSNEEKKELYQLSSQDVENTKKIQQNYCKINNNYLLDDFINYMKMYFFVHGISKIVTMDNIDKIFHKKNIIEIDNNHNFGNDFNSDKINANIYLTLAISSKSEFTKKKFNFKNEEILKQISEIEFQQSKIEKYDENTKITLLSLYRLKYIDYAMFLKIKSEGLSFLDVEKFNYSFLEIDEIYKKNKNVKNIEQQKLKNFKFIWKSMFKLLKDEQPVYIEKYNNNTIISSSKIIKDFVKKYCKFRKEETHEEIKMDANELTFKQIYDIYQEYGNKKNLVKYKKLLQNIEKVFNIAKRQLKKQDPKFIEKIEIQSLGYQEIKIILNNILNKIKSKENSDLDYQNADEILNKHYNLFDFIVNSNNDLFTNKNNINEGKVIKFLIKLLDTKKEIEIEDYETIKNYFIDQINDIYDSVYGDEFDSKSLEQCLILVFGKKTSIVNRLIQIINDFKEIEKKYKNVNQKTLIYIKDLVELNCLSQKDFEKIEKDKELFNDVNNISVCLVYEKYIKSNELNKKNIYLLLLKAILKLLIKFDADEIAIDFCNQFEINKSDLISISGLTEEDFKSISKIVNDENLIKTKNKSEYFYDIYLTVLSTDNQKLINTVKKIFDATKKIIKNICGSLINEIEKQKLKKTILDFDFLAKTKNIEKEEQKLSQLKIIDIELSYKISEYKKKLENIEIDLRDLTAYIEENDRCINNHLINRINNLNTKIEINNNDEQIILNSINKLLKK